MLDTCVMWNAWDGNLLVSWKWIPFLYSFWGYWVMRSFCLCIVLCWLINMKLQIFYEQSWFFSSHLNIIKFLIIRLLSKSLEQWFLSVIIQQDLNVVEVLFITIWKVDKFHWVSFIWLSLSICQRTGFIVVILR